MTFTATGDWLAEDWAPTDWPAIVAARVGMEPRDAYREIAAELAEPNAVHYRLYLPSGASEPTVVCVQDFDYPDYEPERFVEAEAYPYEDLALEALDSYAV